MATQKEKLIKQLAEFLVDKQAAKGICAGMESHRPTEDIRPRFAIEWAALRDAAGTFGYPTVEEETKRLTKLLS